MNNKWFSKINIFIIAILGTILLVGCGKNGETRVTLYYIDNANACLNSFEYVLEKTDRGDSIYEILEQLGKNQQNSELDPPLAKGFSVNSAYVVDKQAVLDFDDGYLELNVADEILIRSAIVKSVIQIDGVDSVLITVNESPLRDSLGCVIPAMTADSFIIGDDIISEKASIKNVTLYFADSMGNGLKAVNRDVQCSNNGTDSIEKILIEQLILGPQDNEASAVINTKTKVKSISVESGICNIDLSKDFQEQVYNVSTDVVIYSIVNTLTELNNVSGVKFSIDGNSEILYQGKYSFTETFEYNADIVNG